MTIRFADAEEAAALPLRKESTRDGTLRLIDVEDFDLSACGGTHVARTGAIGIIAVSGSERFRGGTRLSSSAAAARSTATASCGTAQSPERPRCCPCCRRSCPGAIERLQAEGKDLKRQLKDHQTRLASLEAEALAGRAELVGGVRAVVAALAGIDAGGLKTLATALAARPGHVAVLIATPAPFPIVVARAADVQADSAGLLKQLIATFGGKGGGRPEMAQGGGLQGDPDALLAAARALVSAV